MGAAEAEVDGGDSVGADGGDGFFLGDGVGDVGDGFELAVDADDGGVVDVDGAGLRVFILVLPLEQKRERSIGVHVFLTMSMPTVLERLSRGRGIGGETARNGE